MGVGNVGGNNPLDLSQVEKYLESHPQLEADLDKVKGELNELYSDSISGNNPLYSDQDLQKNGGQNLEGGNPVIPRGASGDFPMINQVANDLADIAFLSAALQEANGAEDTENAESSDSTEGTTSSSSTGGTGSTDSTGSADSTSSTKNTEGVSKSSSVNHWFDANPMATLYIVSLELAFILAQAELKEGLMSADTIKMMTSTAEDIAGEIREIGAKKKAALIGEGVANVVSGGLNIIGAGLSFASFSRNGSETLAGDISATFRGAGQIATGGAEINKGVLAGQEANLEAQKEMGENMLKIAQNTLQNLEDIKKQQQDLLTQVLQELQKMVEAEIKAHGFSLTGGS